MIKISGGFSLQGGAVTELRHYGAGLVTTFSVSGRVVLARAIDGVSEFIR